MDLIIVDVPDVKEVKKEIINSAMAIIAKYLKKTIPPSQEKIAILSNIDNIILKNTNRLEEGKLSEPVKEIKEEPEDGLEPKAE